MRLKFLMLAAAAALAVAAPTPALADGMAGMPGMSAEEHAHMSQDSGTSAGHDHDSMAGMDMSEHNQPAATSKHPVALVLGGFALLNALVLAYAATIRRRPGARKRRQTLERVRATAPRQTVFPATEKRS